MPHGTGFAIGGAVFFKLIAISLSGFFVPSAGGGECAALWASVGVLFFKEFGYANLSWLNFFISGGYLVSVTGTFLIAGSMIYFHYKHKNWKLANG
jgi:hypothetical protein